MKESKLKHIFKQAFWGHCILATLMLVPLVSYGQTTVFLQPADALKLIFKDSKEVHKADHQLSAEQAKAFQSQAGYPPPKASYSFYLGKSGDHIDGYALIDEQVGKVLPITFITLISPTGKVESVEIMVYRESRGGEVKNRRFLNQFVGKQSNDSLKLYGDIVNISGATLSSRALAVGVKRALVLWKVIYGSYTSTTPEP